MIYLGKAPKKAKGYATNKYRTNGFNIISLKLGQLLITEDTNF